MSRVVPGDKASRTRKLFSLACICTLTLVASRTFAMPVTLESIDVGWYREGGYHYDTGAALAGYYQPLGRLQAYASYFAYDVSSVSAEVLSGTLFVPIRAYFSSDPQELVVLYGIWTPMTEVMADHTGGDLDPAIFEDLRSGIVYGSAIVIPENAGRAVAIELTPEAIDRFNNNTSAYFGIGIYLGELQGVSTEYISFVSAFNSRPVRLELEVVPEPTTLLLLAFGSLALLRRRR